MRIAGKSLKFGGRRNALNAEQRVIILSAIFSEILRVLIEIAETRFVDNGRRKNMRVGNGVGIVCGSERRARMSGKSFRADGNA